MPKRLAITIAGAVSLGSYEAGVLYEVLEALRRHNTKYQGDEDRKIYIDVITGASAGGMTAAMAAQRLLYDAASLSGPDTNIFYQAWVTRISLWSLVRLKWKENIWHSIFSSDLIESLGRELLPKPQEELKRNAGKTDVHPAIELARDAAGNSVRGADGNLVTKPLWVGLALTNLDGLDYGYPILEERTDKFQYTRCEDQLAREIAGPPGAAAKLWDELREAAVASGAFPFAFRAKAIKRRRNEYPDTTLEGWPPSTKEKTFTYTDGGVLQNQPIGLAKNLIDDLVGTRIKAGDTDAYNDADSRLYLFVSPHSLRSGVSVGFTAAKANFARMTDELARTYVRQAGFQDWITAEQLNQQVNILDERAQQLAEALAGPSGILDIAALKTAAIQLATLLAGSDSERQARVRRLQTQYARLYSQVLAKGADAAEAWENSMVTLEAAANLQTRDTMNILAVMADGPRELAGAGLSSFAGFFSRKYREHDYTVGRNKARAYLALPEVQKILGKIDVEPSNVPDTSKITKLPLSLWRTLLVGSPALLWLAFWRTIRWWPSALLVLILLGDLCWHVLRYFLKG